MLMRTQPFRCSVLILAALLAVATSSITCFAQGQNFEEALSIFSDTNNQRQLPTKQNQRPKASASEKQAPIGNCGQGEWAQCDYDGINN